MNHREIEERSIPDRYVRGRLEPEERELFEEHMLDCETCQEEVEVTQSFRAALVRAASDDTARVVVGSALGGWLARHRLALVGAAVAALLPALLLVLRNHDLEQDIERLSKPHVSVPSVLLTIARGPEETPVVVTPPNRSAAWWALEVGVSDRAAAYSTRLLDAADRNLWRADDVLADRSGRLVLTFPAGFLTAGDYRLVVDGVTVDGQGLDQASYRFRIRR